VNRPVHSTSFPPFPYVNFAEPWNSSWPLNVDAVEINLLLPWSVHLSYLEIPWIRSCPQKSPLNGDKADIRLRNWLRRRFPRHLSNRVKNAHETGLHALTPFLSSATYPDPSGTLRKIPSRHPDRLIGVPSPFYLHFK